MADLIFVSGASISLATLPGAADDVPLRRAGCHSSLQAQNGGADGFIGGYGNTPENLEYKKIYGCGYMNYIYLQLELHPSTAWYCLDSWHTLW